MPYIERITRTYIVVRRADTFFVGDHTNIRSVQVDGQAVQYTSDSERVYLDSPAQDGAVVSIVLVKKTR